MQNLVRGEVDDGFGVVADAFRANFRDRNELGAGVAVVRDGDRVPEHVAGIGPRDLHDPPQGITGDLGAGQRLIPAGYLGLPPGLLDVSVGRPQQPHPDPGQQPDHHRQHDPQRQVVPPGAAGAPRRQRLLERHPATGDAPGDLQ